MSAGTAAADDTTTTEVETIRDACVSAKKRGKYKGSLDGIKKWIKNELTKQDQNVDRFFDTNGELNLAEFTPKVFESFLVHKRKTVKTSTLGSYRGAIKDMYRVKRPELPQEYGDGMKQLFSGMKRVEAEHDQTSSPKTSGKQPLTYSLYKTLCASTLAASDGGFSHLFLTSQWNLMCRSMSVQTLQTQHLMEKDDSVGVVFVMTKTNQDGSGPRAPRHIYANPWSPSTCWVTALAIYLACHPRLQPGALFPGSNQKLRFGKALNNLLAKTGSAKSYGTHSVRKGVATFSCGGSTGGPSIVSVCLRCGWSIGGVQDRYFRYEAAGDQFLGRVVAGLPVNNSMFAVLPTHFRQVSEPSVQMCMKTMLPDLSGEANLAGVLSVCLASLVHHSDFFDSIYRRTTLYSQHICSRIQPSLNACMINWNGESARMQSTGIPPYLELYKKLDKQQESIDALPNMLEERMEHVLEKKKGWPREI